MGFTAEELGLGKTKGKSGFTLEDLQSPSKISPKPTSPSPAQSQPPQSLESRVLSSVTNLATRVGHNLRDLPMGVATAVASPILQSGQKAIDAKRQKAQNDFLKSLDSQGIKDPRERTKALLDFDKKQGGDPNVIEKFNPKTLESDYPKRIGGTFFDVASLGLGGAEAKAGLGAAEGAGKTIIRKVGTRALEGSALGGARATSQDVLDHEKSAKEKAKDIALQTIAGAVLGGATGAVEGGLAARKASKLITREGVHLPTSLENKVEPTIHEPNATLKSSVKDLPDANQATLTEVPTTKTVTQETKPYTEADLATALDEQASNRSAEAEATLSQPIEKPKNVRETVNDMRLSQEARYDAARDAYNGFNEAIDGKLEDLRDLIKKTSVETKGNFDATHIPGIDDLAQMYRERSGHDITESDFLQMVQEMPTRKEVQSLKPNKEADTPSIKSESKGTPPVKPVGKGDEQLSRAYQRVKDSIIATEGDPTYRQMSIEGDSRKAVQHVNDDFEGVVEALRGRKKLPEGVTFNALSSAAANEAADRGNFGLQAEIERKRTLALTRGGQEIASQQGIDSDTSSGAIDRLVRDRLEKAKERLGDHTSIPKAVDKEVARATTELQKAKLDDFQSFVNSLRC